ncbi:ABC transporter substrate-binding protein [Saccharopolyspora gloriosae]|uniref:Iron complex transport system substrate-binding protein n=1 Tax=Saccharopolyspora gloriosae TaxID=455344 RepID=A0A840NIS6_9PSEU|nr:ABC transporter substrate-binding protein [Saccharopolyspora gloriosae]MBB5069072.1 iron complex transport system substrate-binding protein [Saccharopolyspora gloriosae]
MPFSQARSLRLGLVALAAAVLVSCAAPADDTIRGEAATTVRNCDTDVTVEAPPRRAVSLNQSTTEIMLALGLADRMVGTATWTDPVDPALAEANSRVPRLADNNPSFESVLGTEPDFVLGAYKAVFTDEGVADRERFGELGVPTYLSPSNCFPEEAPLPKPVELDDIYREVQEIADLFGVPERGHALTEQLRGRVAAAQRKVAGLDSRAETSVLFWFARTESPYMAGSTGSPAVMTRALGVRNAYADISSMWPQVSWEDVLARDPDLLVLGDLTRDGEGDGLAAKTRFLHEDPAVSRLAAVRDGHLMGMTGTELNVSMRTVRGIERLADRLVEMDRQR